MKPGDSGEWKTFMRSLKEKAIPIPLIKEVIDKSVGEWIKSMDGECLQSVETWESVLQLHCTEMDSAGWRKLFMGAIMQFSISFTRGITKHLKR